MPDRMIDTVTDYLNLAEAHANSQWTKRKLLSLKAPDGTEIPKAARLGPNPRARLVPRAISRPSTCAEGLQEQVRRTGNAHSSTQANCTHARDTPRLRNSAFVLHVATPRLSHSIADWTESALVALFFAVEKWAEYSQQKRRMSPVVWMINPFALNWVLRKTSIIPRPYIDEMVYDGSGKSFLE